MVNEQLERRIFADRLRKLREEKQLSQKELGEKLGVSRGSISFYENCDRTPDLIFLLRASEFFEVSVNYLVCLTNNRNPDYEAVGSVLDLSDKAIDTIEQTGSGAFLSEFIEHENFPDIVRAAEAFFSLDWDGIRGVDYQAFRITSLIVNVLDDIMQNRIEWVKNAPSEAARVAGWKATLEKPSMEKERELSIQKIQAGANELGARLEIGAMRKKELIEEMEHIQAGNCIEDKGE